MSNKASLTNTELEVTQRLQMHFPRGLATGTLSAVNSCPVDVLTSAIRDMLEKLVSGIKTTSAKILQYITSFTAPATKKFVATEYFVEGQTTDGVPIAWMSPEFKKPFLPKVETDVPKATIRVHELTIRSKDLGIRAEIGEANEEIQLAHFWNGLKVHEAENDKIGKWLIGYITGTDGNLWAVRADRRDDGWCLRVYSVESPYPWLAGYQVLSR